MVGIPVLTPPLEMILESTRDFRGRLNAYAQRQALVGNAAAWVDRMQRATQDILEILPQLAPTKPGGSHPSHEHDFHAARMSAVGYLSACESCLRLLVAGAEAPPCVPYRPLFNKRPTIQ